MRVCSVYTTIERSTHLHYRAPRKTPPSMAYTMATIAALLLACTPATLASPRDRMSPVLNGADLDDRPQYGGMGHRPREHHPVIHPEFPANRVKRHEFGLHKRQTTESNEDYDLVASQSWYWGSGRPTLLRPECMTRR